MKRFDRIGPYIIIGALMSQQATDGVYAYRVVNIYTREKSLITKENLLYVTKIS